MNTEQEPQAQSGCYTAIERLIKWHTAMADEPNRNELKRLKHRETAITLQAMRYDIAKKDAALDACVEALESTGLFLHHCWCDVQMNEYSFGKLNHQMEVVDAAISKSKDARK